MNEAEMVIPHLFRCPISLDLFTDPVTLSTGQTYDRSSIEQWLAAGNLTCPVTMQKLHDPSMVPNHTLRHLIDQWLQTGQQVDPESLTVMGPGPSLAAMKCSLQSQESSLENKLETLKAIRVSSDELSSRNSYMIQLGFLPLLLELVFGQVEAEQYRDSLKLVEEALSCALKLLAFSELGCLNMLKEESKLESLVVLFKHGTPMIKTSVWIVLLVHHDCEASEAGIKAMLALCSVESNKENLIREGAVDGLISYISNAQVKEKSAAPLAIAVLEVLLGVESGREAVLNNPNGVKALVKMTFKVSDHQGSENAVSSLMVLCTDSLRAREEAISAGVLSQLLFLLQSQCSGTIKTKARMLLKLLRSKRIMDQNHGTI
ncbi:U-box domain-containing protein 26 [Vitis vinifera]|uniref:U-box domain-containing protein n=1 Tax=Vitis vinifera TaxID=29760 RepID=A0A438HR39_VITVI|nr:U-box domain-containing protein 26 [Vitis vinifera]